MLRVFLLLLFLPVLAFAQGGQRLTLAEAEALWRSHNREIRLADVAVSSAEADVQAAGQRPNPQLSINTLSISPWSGYGTGGWKDKKMDTQLRLDQLIERGDKRELRLRGAGARLDAARSDLDDTLRTQRLALHGAYFDLLLAQERFRLAGETAQLYARSQEASRVRHKAGDISLVELSRLQIEKSRADNEMRQAEADLEKARVALAYLIGRERTAAQLVAGDPWPGLELPPERPARLEERPDVVAARLRLQAAETARDLARAQKKRDITVGVQLEHNLQNPPTNSYGFGISLPLFLWHENEGEIARAEAELSAAQQLLERALAQAVGDVDQARSSLRAAAERRRRLEEGLLTDAGRVAKAAELAYSKGAMGLMDLLDARRTLRQIESEAAAARAEYAKALSAWRLQAEYVKQ